MYCVIKCIVHGNQARVKNADLPHPSCTVVMQRRKSASPIRTVLKCLKSCRYTPKYNMERRRSSASTSENGSIV